MIEQAEAATGIPQPSDRPPGRSSAAQKRGRSRGFLRVVRSRAADQGGDSGGNRPPAPPVDPGALACP